MPGTPSFNPADVPSGNCTDSFADEIEATIIVPTLNEGGNIGALIDRLLAEHELAGRIEVLVSDDGSGDSTVAEVESRARDNQRVRLHRRSGTRDLTAAVLEAARLARGRYCLVMDADGSHPIEAVARLLEPLRAGEADVVVGSRHVQGGAIGQWPWWRRLNSRAAALIAWPFTHARDPMSGFFATTRQRLSSLQPLQAGYKVLLEVLVRTTPPPRLLEVPYQFNDREAGSSKMNARVRWLFFRRLAALGGARLTLGNMSRFGLVGLSGVAVDLAVFWILRQWLGTGLATAHFGAFAAATLSNFVLNYHWTFARQFEADRPALQRYAAFLVVALLALAMRGGILGLLTEQFAISAALAILPAVAMTAVVNYLGSIFYVFPARAADTNPEIRWRMAALALIGFSLGLRWLYLGQVELIFDEMYYWVYTLHPALSYLDHPPLTAWLILAGTWLLGDTPAGVRLATLVLAPLALAFAYLYTRNIFDKTRALLAAMLVAVVPAWFGSGFLMTTDAAAVTAWLAALYFLHRALVVGQPNAWFGVAISLGLGALAKYTVLFLVPAIAVLMLFHGPARQALRQWQAWAAALLTLALFSPVLIWNAGNDWASFAFQSTRRISEDAGFHAHWLPLQTVVALAPLAGLAMLWLLGPARRQLCPDDTSRRFMLCMTLTPLAVIAVFSMFTAIKLHWLVPAWLGMLPLLAATVYPPAGISPAASLKFLHAAWRPLLPLSLIFCGLLMHYASIGLPGVPWQPHRLGYMGWPEIAQEVHRIEQQVEQRTGRRPIIAGMAKWSIPAALAFHDADGRRDNITARNIIGMSGSQWERWFDPETDPERPVILVSHEPKLIDEAWLERALTGLGPLQSTAVERDGMTIQHVYYRIADGFRPEQLRYPGHIPE
ncbi:MAG: glycosyltransferase family 39 protein [Wenzhouxiangellaceae bacterium]